jgi:predicted PurR-regulated permease PerM
MARIVSLLVLIAILVIISIIFFQVMAGFFVPLFLAALLGVVVQPLHRWIADKCRGHQYLAAGITTTIVALIVLLPIGFVLTTATLEGLSLIDELQLADVRKNLNDLRTEFGLQIPREQDVRHIEATLHAWREKQRSGQPLDLQPAQIENVLTRVRHIKKWLADNSAATIVPVDAMDLETQLEALRDSEPGSIERDEAVQVADAEFRKFKRDLLGGTYRSWLTEWANPSEEQLDQIRRTLLSASAPVLSLGSDTFLFVAKLGFGTLMMMVGLFFLLAEGTRMLEALIRISPLEEQHVRELVTEFDRACRAIVSATLFSAIAQGLLAGVGFYFCGLRSSVALLTVLTMVLALVPFTGAAAVWIPVCLYLYFFKGSIAAAIGLALYGTFVISMVDNIIKPLVLHGQSKLHPLLALLSVLGGIQALGPIGIVVGPMVVVFLQTLLKILQRELMSMDRSSWMFWRGMGAATAAETPAAGGEGAAASTATGSVAVAANPPGPSSQLPGNGQPPGAANKQQPQHHGKKRRK